MGKNRQERVLYCSKCYACEQDCKQVDPVTNCIHFKQGITRQEYIQLIKEENVDIAKLCDKYGVSRNIMFEMLQGKRNFSYKYRQILNSRLLELDEFLPYVEKFEQGEMNG